MPNPTPKPREDDSPTLEDIVRGNFQLRPEIRKKLERAFEPSLREEPRTLEAFIEEKVREATGNHEWIFATPEALEDFLRYALLEAYEFGKLDQAMKMTNYVVKSLGTEKGTTACQFCGYFHPHDQPHA